MICELVRYIPHTCHADLCESLKNQIRLASRSGYTCHHIVSIPEAPELGNHKLSSFVTFTDMIIMFRM